MRSGAIYLDFNATTPIDPAVAEAMLPCLYERFGNPSSAHPYGVEARRAVEEARAQVAGLLSCRPEEIVFTSGGTESNNMVLQGMARKYRSRGGHFIVSAIEHPAIAEPVAALETEGFRVTRLPVDGMGRVDSGSLERAITPETILVSIMHANNEVGTVQPIPDLARIARSRGVAFHTDAAQSAGKIPVRVDELGVDFLSLAGHKLYAPKGVGALYVRSGTELPPLVFGASHERGMRAGTENVLGAVGLGKACAIAASGLDRHAEHLRSRRDRLWERLSASSLDLRWNGDPENGLPNTLSVSFARRDAGALLAIVSDRLAVSAGAACHAHETIVSPVLSAMGVPAEYAMGTLRLSTGRPTSIEDVDRAADILVQAARELERSGRRSAAAP